MRKEILTAHQARKDHADAVQNFNGVEWMIRDNYERSAREGVVALGGIDFKGNAQWRAAKAEVERCAAELNASDAAVGGRVYRVPGHELHTVQGRIEKMQKRAAKLGIDAPTCEIVSDEYVEHTIIVNELFGSKRTVHRHWYYIVVAGGEPKLAGWTFLATIQHLDGVNVIRRVPGTDETVNLDGFRDAAPTCDHCNTVRRRKDTFVVQHDNGEIKRVGRQCVADFLGMGDPQQIAGYCEFWREFAADFGGDDEDEMYGRGGGRSYMSTHHFLSHVCTMLRTYGWVSRSAAGWDKRATADDATQNFYAEGQYNKDGSKAWVEVTDADKERATAALTWVRETLAAQDRLSEFDHNLVAMTAGDYVPEKGEGITAYLPVAHARAMEKEIERVRVAKQGENSDHVGTIGQRTNLTLMVESIHEHEGNYGVTFITKLSDQQGNVYKWFGSYELDRGETYEGKWTIKNHDEYQGVKETVINRPKLTKVEVVQEALAV